MHVLLELFVWQHASSGKLLNGVDRPLMQFKN